MTVLFVMTDRFTVKNQNIVVAYLKSFVIDDIISVFVLRNICSWTFGKTDIDHGQSQALG